VLLTIICPFLVALFVCFIAAAAMAHGALLAASGPDALFAVVQSDDVSAQRDAARSLRALAACTDCGAHRYILMSMEQCCRC
jgi:hypothetical protein